MIDTSSFQQPRQNEQQAQPLRTVIKSKKQQKSFSIVNLGIPQQTNQEALFDGLWISLREHINHLFSDGKVRIDGVVFYKETSYKVRKSTCLSFFMLERHTVMQDGIRQEAS